MSGNPKGKGKRWQLAIAARSNDGKCMWCGGEGCDPCHIIPRGFLLTKWLVENGLWFCRKHHIKFDADRKFRAHIIKVLVKVEVYNKLCEVRDGKRSYEECGFTIVFP